jgi:acyl carrier protein
MVKEPTLRDIEKELDILLEDKDQKNLEELAELIDLLSPPK